MSDGFATVAKYSVPLEAQLAKGLLESEGIEVQLFGDLGATMLNYGAAGGLVELRVAVWDAARALRLLEAQRERVRRGDEWQDEADEDVWVCTLCGSAVPNDRTACTDCKTPRDAVQTDAGGRLQLQRATPEDRSNAPAGIRADQPPAASIKTEEAEGTVNAPNLVTLYGDDLAKRACLAALAPLLTAPFTCITMVFLPVFLVFAAISAWYLLQLVLFNNGELSRTGWLYLVAALVFNASYIGIGGFLLFSFLPH